ncbi:Pentatricopeptide repeat-containing protein [Hibiscus syriacus]|uniref:Pentatricopeptide repeat-containing protein n=1 Tax=Hibiscus syriacus TaxID=106335 RepID=A0A6A2WVH0_HIBSY|nr:Pentatricopeptide repeat-containing protein [Hibiscus syriacus]
MVDDEVIVDIATVVSVLPVSGFLKALEVGKRVYELVKEKGWEKEIVVRNALVDMFAKCGSMAEARSVFNGMDQRDVVTCTSLINAHILNGDLRAAVRLCFSMVLEGVRPNSVTLASLLSVCGESNNLMDGRCLHGWAIRQKLESDVMVETSLIDMYAKCNCIDLSFQVFKRTSKKKTVPWNAILAGCIHNRLGNEAIKLFKEMLIEGVKPDGATLKSFLPAYAIHANLQQAMNMHSYLVRSGLLSNSEIAIAVVDIYSKCGCLESAHMVFNGIPDLNKDIYAWSVIIPGYGAHGNGEVAVSLFTEMVRAGVKPNEVTFGSVLHACSHAGLVDEGLDLFNFMLRNYQISPKTDHYTCIVDLLGRSGRPDEAYDIIRTMPFSPNHAVWGALLGACVIHGNVDLGEIAAKRLFELEPGNTGNYVLMAKIYSAVGRWEDAENMRRIINEIGLRKAPAHNLIQHSRPRFLFTLKEKGPSKDLQELTDGSDIGPKTFPAATSVATLKESFLAQWPKEEEDGPRTVKDLKLISAGKILENNRTLGECQSPLCDIPGGLTTMHVVVQTPPGKDEECLNWYRSSTWGLLRLMKVISNSASCIFII